MHAYDPQNPPLWLSANVLNQILSEQPRRLALAGPAGSGKSSLASVIAGDHPELVAEARYRVYPPVPVFNHADAMKDEVVEWVSGARSRALIPDETATFVSWCDFLGISPSIVKNDLWEVLGPVWEEFRLLLEAVYEERVPVAEFAGAAPGERLPEKVRLVERHKPLFRSALQLYGEAIKVISGNPGHWVEQTVTRGLGHGMCLNADTRYPEEMEILRGAGWTGVYLKVSAATQRRRRPEMTAAQRAHPSETALKPRQCDVALDANQSLGKVVMDLAEWLARRGR